MTKEELIEKLLPLVVENLDYVEMVLTDPISLKKIQAKRIITGVLNAIQETHYLVEKDKVEVVEPNDYQEMIDNHFISEKGIINKAWVL